MNRTERKILKLLKKRTDEFYKVESDFGQDDHFSDTVGGIQERNYEGIEYWQTSIGHCV